MIAGIGISIAVIVGLLIGVWIYKKGYEMGFNAFYRAKELLPLETFEKEIDQEVVG